MSAHDINALLDAAEYFENEADLQRGIIATPGTERADDANAEAHRFDRYARAIDAAAKALTEPEEGTGDALAFEYEIGELIRAAVEHDADRMRFYLKCSVGELAQRIVRSALRGASRAAAPVVPLGSGDVVQRVRGMIYEHELSGYGPHGFGNAWELADRIVSTVLSAARATSKEET